MSLARRSYQQELLDEANIPFGDILLNMQELDRINTLLGGHEITCKGLSSILAATNRNGRLLRIAEIGCGGGDNLAAINQFAKKKGIPVELTGIDLKQECIDAARQQNKVAAKWICSDYRDVAFTGGKPDIIFSSLFCHHFTDDELVEQLRWLQTNSDSGFFINDLHRSIVAYYAIKWITRIFSKSYLVKNDAPLSVKRGFKRADWKRLLQVAGISNYSIRWQWAFRYLVCVSNGL